MPRFNREEQRANLKKLADHLRTSVKPENFDMGGFFYNHIVHNKTVDVRIDESDYGCGTVACALGHAPLATGIAKERNETWLVYGDRVFGLLSLSTWDWLFSSDWIYTQPKPQHAASRIEYYLKYGQAPINMKALHARKRPDRSTETQKSPVKE